jgi:RNA polymerase-binding transcription factor
MKDNRLDLLEKLTDKKKEFEQALKRLIDKQKDYQEHLEADSAMDESDQALREISLSSNYSLIERKARELKNIDRLIRQVDADAHFGMCEECGKRIPPERLLIVPEATLCVACQRELEKVDSLRKMSRQNSLRLRMHSAEDQGSENELPVLDDEIIDSGLEIIPFADLEEPPDPAFLKDE